MSDGRSSPTYVWKPWKVAVVALACLLTAGGLVSALVEGGDAATPPAAGSSGAASPGGATRVSVPGAEGFTSELPPIETPDGTGGTPSPGGAPSSAAPVPGDESLWTPALLRGGLSFLVGFSLAYAARIFLKIAVFFVGVWAASLFLLSSLGWIEVHWHAIDAAFSGWASRIGDQFASARAFITGSLPSTGMAGLGLFTGLRRK
jgi:uncharacterized membrane protein (Fun14 family)